MTSAAEVLFFSTGHGFEELILVVAGVGIVTGKAVADRGRVNGSLDVGCFLIGVTGETESIRSGRDQLDARDIFIDPDLMAAQTSGRHGGMNGLALVLVLVALKALGGIGVLLQRDGMNCCECAWTQQHGQLEADPKGYTKTGADVIKDRFAADALGKQSHGAPMEDVQPLSALGSVATST